MNNVITGLKIDPVGQFHHHTTGLTLSRYTQADSTRCQCFSMTAYSDLDLVSLKQTLCIFNSHTTANDKTLYWTEGTTTGTVPGFVWEQDYVAVKASWNSNWWTLVYLHVFVDAFRVVILSTVCPTPRLPSTSSMLWEVSGTSCKVNTGSIWIVCPLLKRSSHSSWFRQALDLHPPAGDTSSLPTSSPDPSTATAQRAGWLSYLGPGSE